VSTDPALPRVCPTGRWHVSFGVLTAAKPTLANGLPGCGVDFGVACSAYVSDEDAPRLMPPTLTPGERQRLLEKRRPSGRRGCQKQSGWGREMGHEVLNNYTEVKAVTVQL
jgi:hypothetical protein